MDLKKIKLKNFVVPTFVVVSSLLVFYISGRLELFEQLSEYVEANEEYELDELIVVIMYLFIFTTFFYVMKWRELNKALKEIKELKGIVPICSSCKNIRDDKGYWHKVEKYIGEHTDANFSHGICPECMKKLYPEIEDKKSSDTTKA